MNVEQFKGQLGEDGITLTSQQLEQFELYFQLLVEWNHKMNLTAITDKEGVYLKHFYDSISAATFYDFDQQLSIVDVGAGAGFPSIPLKICFPHLQITIVDSLNKRITFLDHLREKLGLDNIHLFHDRAETFAQKSDHREQYDLAMARAVARLNILAELCLPLVKMNGNFLVMKATKGEEELAEATKAIAILGGQLQKADFFQLPNGEGKRYFMLVHKTKKSPKKYPRKPGTPNKQPIL